MQFIKFMLIFYYGIRIMRFYFFKSYFETRKYDF